VHLVGFIIRIYLSNIKAQTCFFHPDHTSCINSAIS